MALPQTWAELMDQIQQNRVRNYEGSYLDGTYVDGRPAQIMIDPSGRPRINFYGDDTRYGYNKWLTPGANGSVNQEYYKEDNGIPWGAFAVLAAPFAAAAMGAGAAGAGAAEAGAGSAAAAGAAEAGAAGAAGTAWTSGFDLAFGDGLASAGTGALGAGSYVIPTAEELAAGGFGSGGIGLTGAGGIGAADSVVGAGAGAAGYGSTASGAGALGGVGNFLTSKAGSSLAGGLLSGISSMNAPKSTTATSTNQIDPRMSSILYGDGTANNTGFLNRVLQVGNQSQSAGMQSFGQGMDNYLGLYGRGAFDNNMRAADAVRDTRIGAPTASAAQVQAPSQNNINLSPAYKDMIYGKPGNNPYLTGAIQKGINQSNYAFGNYLTDATKATQDVLGNIRGGAVLNNTMGSSRQGIAEGRAIGDLTQNLGRAATQFGINNTDAAVAAQAGAYDADRNRALSAMSGLGAQQYGVASQNASMQQQANLANMQSQLQTNALNSDNQRAGIGLSSGLLGQAAGYAQNQDSYNLNKLGKVGGLLGAFTGLNNTQSTTQPLYNNTAGNILGGALAGASLWKAFQ